jgi:hypothetical protein
MHEGYHDPGSRTADGMTECDSPAKIRSEKEVGLSHINRSHPLILILAGSIFKTCSEMRTTTEKASLISKREMSSTVSLAFSRALGKATVGAMGKSIGSTPASA